MLSSWYPSFTEEKTSFLVHATRIVHYVFTLLAIFMSSFNLRMAVFQWRKRGVFLSP